MATAISSELTCPICLELFEDPVTLACMHSYCRHCLESILKSSGGKRLCCPECRLEATMNNEVLQKMPRNFILANIVAKCEREDKAPKIPCDLCDEKPPSYAVKRCKECKISYCGQCLFLHPKKGVLATHTLVDPQNFESEGEKKPSEKFCMKCVLVLKYEDDKEYCLYDHPAEIMDIETAKTKMMNGILEAIVRIDDRKKKYIKDAQATEGVLDKLKTDEEKSRSAIRDEMTKKCEEATRKAKLDFQDQIDGIQEVFEGETKRIENEFDEWSKETRDRNVKLLQWLQDSSAGISDLIAEMQSLFATQRSEAEIDIKDLMKTYLSVNEMEMEGETDISLYQGFNLTEKLEKVKIPPNVKGQEIQNERVEITNCISNLRKENEGASVTVYWSSTSQDAIFEIKFMEITREDIGRTVMIRGIRGHQYTETCLQHDTTYDITVSIQYNPSSESECKILSTLPGVSCDEFQFSSTVKSCNMVLRWDNKRVTNITCDSTYFSSDAINNVWGAVGTMQLNRASQYWESLVTYHLRGIEKDCNATAVGICVQGKIDAINSIAMNYFFYGVGFGKNKKGVPSITITEGGLIKRTINMKTTSNYNNRVGFYFDANHQRLVIIDVDADSVLYQTGKLKKAVYFPISELNGGDASIELITGSGIQKLPPCLKQHF